MRRRQFLSLAAGSAAATVLTSRSASVRAAAWPERPVRIIVPFAAGGATDLVARPWAELLGQRYKQQFVIENRGGASGMIGAEAAARSAPDGYTFFFSSNTTTITLPLMRKMSYDPQSLVPVARMGDSISGFVIHPSVQARTFKELIDYARANPDKLAFGSSGNGSLPHLRYEMLILRTGVSILHVPYRGGADTLQDVLAGNVHIMNEGSSVPHVKAGKLIMLAVNHTERFAGLPDVPTLTECGYPDSDVPAWFSLYAPRGTPQEVMDTLNSTVNEISKSDDMRKRLEMVAAVPIVQTVDGILQYMELERKRTAELIKARNIKFE